MMTLKSGLRYHLVNRDRGLVLGASSTLVRPSSMFLTWSMSAILGGVVSQQEATTECQKVLRVGKSSTTTMIEGSHDVYVHALEVKNSTPAPKVWNQHCLHVLSTGVLEDLWVWITRWEWGTSAGAKTWKISTIEVSLDCDFTA